MISSYRIYWAFGSYRAGQVSRILFFLCFILTACNGGQKPGEKSIVTDASRMDKQNSEYIRTALGYATSNNGKLDDSISLRMPAIVNE